MVIYSFLYLSLSRNLLWRSSHLYCLLVSFPILRLSLLPVLCSFSLAVLFSLLVSLLFITTLYHMLSRCLLPFFSSILISLLWSLSLLIYSTLLIILPSTSALHHMLLIHFLFFLPPLLPSCRKSWLSPSCLSLVPVPAAQNTFPSYHILRVTSVRRFSFAPPR